MATIRPKRGTGSPSGLSQYELAVDTSGRQIFIGNAGGTGDIVASHTTINGITGAVGISAGSNITVTQSGNTLTIASTASGSGGVTTLNGLSGAVGISAGTGIDVTLSGNTLTIVNTVAAGSNAATVTTTSTNSASTFYPVLAGGAAGVTALYVDNVTTPMSYVPSTGALTAKSFNTTAVGGQSIAVSATNLTLTDTAGSNSVSLDTSGIAAGSALNLYSDTGVVLSSPAAVEFVDPLGGAYDYFFPTTNGTAGQVLTTDGLGTLTWGSNGVTGLIGGTGISVSSQTGNVTVSLTDRSTTQTIDFSQTVNGLFFTVTGITTSNDVYRFANIAGKTAALRNASGTVNITGKIYSADSYWNGGVTYSVGVMTGGSPLVNSRSVDIEMRSPFTQGVTTYYAEDLTSLSIVYLYDTNEYTRLLGSSIVGDGYTAGLTFGGGQTFSVSGLTLMHNEGTDVVRTVTGLSWVTADSFITCKCLGLTNDDHEPEDAILEGVRFEVENIVPGTGFDIIGHAPEGTYGKYKIKCLGQ